MKIIYKGTSDVRILSADDLKKAGVENFKKTSFSRDSEVEVDDEVGEALVGNQSGLFAGEFKEAKDEESKSDSDSDDEDLDTDTSSTQQTDDTSTTAGPAKKAVAKKTTSTSTTSTT